MSNPYSLGYKIGQAACTLIDSLLAQRYSYEPTVDCSSSDDDEVSESPRETQTWDWPYTYSDEGITVNGSCKVSGAFRLLAVDENPEPRIVWSNDALRIVQTGFALPIFHLEKYHGLNLMGGETWVAVDPANSVEAAFVIRDLTREFGRYVANDQLAHEMEAAAIYG